MQKIKLLGFLLLLIFVSSCSKTNEEVIIEDYLTSMTNADGSVTKIKVGEYTFHSFEPVDVDGKFVYSILNPEIDSISKSSIEDKIKYDINRANKHYLYSAIAFKRSLKCSSSEWRQELEYERNSEKYSDEALDYESNAYTMSRIYNNYDSVTVHLIEATYDYKLENLDTKGIVKYFVLDKEANKIVDSFSSLGEEFIVYYFKSAKGLNLDDFGIKLYKYTDLLDMDLDSLVPMLDK